MSLVSRFTAGQTICREGEEGNVMYIIKSGKIEVLKEMGDDETMLLATLGPKEFFGEMALFGVKRRTATVRALTDSDVVVVNKKMLETQYRKIPDWLVSMIKTLASRIISTSKGTKTLFQVSIQYTILQSVLLISEMKGSMTAKGRVIPQGTLRDELMYTLGLSYDDIDVWLKRFNLVNIVQIQGGKSMIEIPDFDRAKRFAEYLCSLSPECNKKKPELEPELQKSFERMNKLLTR